MTSLLTLTLTPDTPLSEAICAYIEYAMLTHQLKGKSQKSYGSSLRNLTRWIEKQVEEPPRLSHLSHGLLRVFLEGFMVGHAPATIRCKHTHLHSFCNYLVERGYTAANLLDERPIKMPKIGAQKRLLVTDLEVATVIAACDHINPVRMRPLLRALFTLMATAALRHEELINLTLKDVSLDEKCVTVRHGKGDKSRRLFIGDDAMTALAAWLEVRPKDTQHDFLWAVSINRRMAYDALSRWLERVKDIAGYSGAENIKPHSIRHYAATRMLRNGMTLEDVRCILGHTNIKMTARYLHSDEERLRSISHLAALPRIEVTLPGITPAPELRAEPIPAPKEQAEQNGRKRKRGASGQQRKGYVPAHKRRDVYKPFRPLPDLPEVKAPPAQTPQPLPIEKKAQEGPRSASWRKEPPRPEPAALPISRFHRQDIRPR